MIRFHSAEEYFTELPELKRITAIQIHRVILNTHPKIQSEIKYNTPFYTYFGLLFYLTTYQKKHLTLGFCQGRYMADPSGILIADAGQTQVKHWRFNDGDVLDFNLLAQYILEACLINESLHHTKKLRK